MRHFWFLVLLLYSTPVDAQTMVVTDIKVSVTADSPAAAREKAIDQAHSLAFQKLMRESFPENSGNHPSSDVLMNMVTDFSINREKTTPKSYTASLTFQFDESQVHAWLQQEPSSSPSSRSPENHHVKHEPLKIIASYTTFPEWHHIKKTLETLPGMAKVSPLSLSPREATIEVFYRDSVEKLQQSLLQKNLTLSQQEQAWHLSRNTLLQN